MKIAVAGAGIYGSTIAVRLAGEGHRVELFDPLGVLCAASGINQYRAHAGYHYPRSLETIAETLQARDEFQQLYQEAIIKNAEHYYAIPHLGSRTTPKVFESVMDRFGLPVRPSRPPWMNFDFIDRCYAVDEQLYDPAILRAVIEARVQRAKISFRHEAFDGSQRENYDYVIWATYGLGAGQRSLASARYQVAEKVLVQLPPILRGISLVVIDGPFTAFDPYASSGTSLFGSAKHTNHWTTADRHDPALDQFAAFLNKTTFTPVRSTHFERMRADAKLAAPCASEAEYLGSRFTIRVVADDPEYDRRTLTLTEPSPGELHVFSGKVVGAVKAARLVSERVNRHA